MDRAVENLLQQFEQTLNSLRGRAGAPSKAVLAPLEVALEEALRAALHEADLYAARDAARSLEAQVADLPLPQVELQSGERAELLARQVELLRLAAALHHEFDSRL